MWYNALKILHITSAALLVALIILAIYLWRSNDMHYPAIQKQSVCLIAPLALWQLISGFTMISLKYANGRLLWISGSITGFMLFIFVWFIFVYSLFYTDKKRLQTYALGLAVLILLTLIFLMSTRI